MMDQDSSGDNNENCIVPAPVFLQVYQVLAILVGVVGNGFVIYASKQYSTFNLDSNTIFLVRHLGYVDIAILVLGFFPANFMFVYQLDKKPGPFSVICTIQGICMNVFGLTALSITALISVHRLLRCTLPQAIARMRRNLMLSVVVVCYAAAISVAVLVMVIPPKLTYRYDNGYYSCIGHFKPDQGAGHSEKKIARGVGMALGALFFVIIILINVLLHHFSRKKLANLSGNSLKKHKTSRYRTLTTHSISALLVVTWLPFAITFFITISLESTENMVSCQLYSSVRHVSTFAINFYLLNFVLNPLLYSVTNINFMKFVIKLIKKHCSNLLCVAQLCTKLNPDLDISTNVSTMDQVAGGSSNNCPVTPERVYSNMLTVPDQASTKRKLSPVKSDPTKKKYVKKGSSTKKSVAANNSNNNNKVVVITVSDDIKSDSLEIVQMPPTTQNSKKNKKKKDSAKKKTEIKKVSV